MINYFSYSTISGYYWLRFFSIAAIAIQITFISVPFRFRQHVSCEPFDRWSLVWFILILMRAGIFLWSLEFFFVVIGIFLNMNHNDRGQFILEGLLSIKDCNRNKISFNTSRFAFSCSVTMDEIWKCKRKDKDNYRWNAGKNLLKDQEWSIKMMLSLEKKKPQKTKTQ